MLCKVPNFLGKFTIEHKTNNFPLAVKCQIGSANALPSHGPGNEETSRKWGSPSDSETRKQAPDHCRRHLRRTLRIARRCDGVFKNTEPQQTLNSLFSCLGSSVKDT